LHIISYIGIKVVSKIKHSHLQLITLNIFAISIQFLLICIFQTAIMAEFNSSSLINIHTHTPPLDDEYGIVDCPVEPDREMTGITGRAVSAGIHPWEAGAGDVDRKLLLLEKLAGLREVVAVGESGLDRVKGPLPDIQRPVMEAQAEIAAKAGKPMILHCVRAFPEIISLRKSFGSAPPWIIHGFTGNLQIMQQLITHDFYLSFGRAALNPSNKLAIVIRNVPLERIFFETDDSGERVSEIYNSFARFRGIGVRRLIRRINDNFAALFNL
jgi:TatD DNase family protein